MIGEPRGHQWADAGVGVGGAGGAVRRRALRAAAARRAGRARRSGSRSARRSTSPARRRGGRQGAERAAHPSVPTIHRADLPALLAAAGGMALVIFSESLGAAENFATQARLPDRPQPGDDRPGRLQHRLGLVGGLAGGGSLSQTAVNDGAGARSELSPLVATMLSLVTVLVLTPLFTDLPEAVLAALIIHAVSHLWKIAEFRRYYRRARPSSGWACDAGRRGRAGRAPGLLIGVVSMLVLSIYHASRPRSERARGGAGRPRGVRLNVERHPDYPRLPGVLVLRLGARCSTSTPRWSRATSRSWWAATALPRAVVLDIGATDRLDITSAEAWTTWRRRCSQRASPSPWPRCKRRGRDCASGRPDPGDRRRPRLPDDQGCRGRSGTGS